MGVALMKLGISKPKTPSLSPPGDCFFVKLRLGSRHWRAKSTKPLPSVGEAGEGRTGREGQEMSREARSKSLQSRIDIRHSPSLPHAVKDANATHNLIGFVR